MKKNERHIRAISGLFFVPLLLLVSSQITACAAKYQSQNIEHLQIGVAHLNRAHVDLAEQEFRTVLATDPSNWAAHYELGRLESLRGNAMGAMDHFSIVLQQQPYNASAHANMGWAMIQMHELNEAELHLKKAMELGGEETLVHSGLGVISFHRQQPKESKIFFDRALQKNPNDSLAHYYENIFFEPQNAANDPGAMYNDLQQAARFSFKPFNDVVPDVRSLAKNEKSGPSSSGKDSGSSGGNSSGGGSEHSHH